MLDDDREAPQDPLCEADRTKQEQHMQESAVYLVMNQNKIEVNKFGADAFVRQSESIKQQFNQKEPSWLDFQIKSTSVQDNTALIDFGVTDDELLSSYQLTGPYSSKWQQYPHHYKFVGVDVNFTTTLHVIERSTYGLLEFVGDMGGLLDALMIMGALLVYPMAEWHIKNTILHALFMFKPRNSEETKVGGNGPKDIDYFATEHLRKVQKIVPLSYGRYLALSCRERKRRNRLMKLSEVKYTKEMDLIKFI